MRIVIAPEGVRLEEASEFTRFAVIAPGGVDEAGDALAAHGVGTVRGGQVVVSVEALQELAGPLAGQDDWRAGLEAMLACAASRGWTTPDGTGILAHVEEPTRTPGGNP